MNFETPVLLLLLIPLTVFLVLCPFKSRTAAILQFLLFLLLTAALAGLSFKQKSEEGILFILCDRSRSMPPDSEARMERQIREISKRMKSPPGIISFAGTALLEQSPGSNTFKGFTSVLSDRESSNLTKALTLALNKIPRDTPGRILLISDGKWNGLSPEKVFFTAAMRKIKVDLLPLSRDKGNDFAITGLTAPSSAVPGESCALALQIEAPFASSVKCRIRKNKGVWQERQLKLKAGTNHIFWRDTPHTPGIVSYDFHLVSPAGDTVSENDFSSHLLQVKGENKLLLLTHSPSGNLGKLLQNSGFKVDISHPASPRLTPGTLGNYQAVILENIPASSLSRENNALLAELVRSGRTGLLMTGGQNSFAVGGWFKTPIGDILPVSMEQQNDIRRRKSAVMIALDRSGSMAAMIDGVSKMMLANKAAVESFSLLSDEDEFGLIAVDTAVHEVAPLQFKKKRDPSGDILAIESSGGGIFVDKALHEATRQLLNSKAPVRHLLLFADASDAENPGDYKQLLARSSKAGITVSVVGLGSPVSSDAELLRDIARRGGGRCYFADNARELPRIFAEDTFVMVRNSFRTEKIQGRYTSRIASLPGAEKLSNPIETAGCNLSFARPKSSVLLTAADDEKSPLAVTGFAGMGRCAALMIEADGKYTGAFGNSPDAGTLLASLVRYVVMPHTPEGRDYMITKSVHNGVFKSEILLDPELLNIPFEGTPRLSALLSFPDGKIEKRSCLYQWQGPDRLSASLELPPGTVLNAAVEIQGKGPLLLSPAVNALSFEFSPDDDKNITPFIHTAGGRIRSQFDDMASFLPRKEERYDCVPLLLCATAAVLLLQVFLRRSGSEIKFFSLPEFRFKKKPVSAPKVRPAPSPAPTKKEELLPEVEADTDAISNALKQAKRK